MQYALNHTAIKAFKEQRASVGFEIDRCLGAFLDAFENGIGASLLEAAYSAGDWTFLEVVCGCIDWPKALQSISKGKHQLSYIEARVLRLDCLGHLLA